VAYILFPGLAPCSLMDFMFNHDNLLMRAA